jgi:hypothetical protein
MADINHSGFFEQVPNIELMSVFDVYDLSNMSANRLGAYYQEKLHGFYASVFALLSKVPGLLEDSAVDGGAWAIFHHVDEGVEGPVLMAPRKDTLLHVKSRGTSTHILDYSPTRFIHVMME